MVDRLVVCPAFFNHLVMQVMYSTEHVAGLDCATIADLWRRASNDEVRAASHAQLVDFVRGLGPDRMEAGLQALCRLLPGSVLWADLWAADSIDAGLRHKYRAWLRMSTISATMDKAAYIFWGEAICTRAIGYMRALRLLLQCMTLTEACAGFRRHQAREAIQATVRAWAKRIAKDKTPVYRDPVRVLAGDGHR